MTHRTRLMLTTVGASGPLLALVFVGVFWFSRSLQVTGARNVLDAGINQLVDDLNRGERPDLKEVHEAYPRATFALFDNSRKVLDKAGPAPTTAIQGVRITSSPQGVWLSEGVDRKGLLLMGVLDWTAPASELSRLATMLALVWLLAQGTVAFVTWYAVGATFRPLRELTDQATRMSGSDLALRLDSSDKAEFGEFVEKLNLLLERIEQTARREKQFSADAAHELRTPLAILLASLDTALMNERTGAEYKKTIQNLVPEVLRLTHLVELLLSSARSEFEPAESLELSGTVAETLAAWRDRFQGQGVELRATLNPARAQILPDEFRSVLDNLLENALKFSPRGSTCTVEIGPQNGCSVLTVRDEGPGIPDGVMPIIFDRFVTGHRDRGNGSYGIGLSICRNIVSARGGTISAQNTHRGAKFSVILP